MKIHLSRLASGALVLGLSLMSSNCGSPSTPSAPSGPPSVNAAGLTPPPGATAAMVEEGARIFATGSCPLCHGPNGKNGPYGPDLTDQVYLQNDGSWDGIAATITSGVPAGQFKSPASRPEFFMQPRGGLSITDAQVRSLAAYVWALSHH